MAEGRSGIETPSYIYAMVLAFFLIMSLIIEKVVEFIEHGFDKFGRKGLKLALNSIIREVMMLGFISLVLTVIEDPISEICVKKFTHHEQWVQISHIKECDSCLEHTRGLSAEYKDEHQQCSFWNNDDHDGHDEGHDDHSEGHEGHDSQPEDHNAHDEPHDEGPATEDHHHDSHHRRRLLSGGGHEDICGEGEEVLVSVALLHEVHLAIFLLTVTHISNVIVMVILANFRVNRWRRWKLEDDKCDLCVSATFNTVTLKAKPESSASAPTEVIVEHSGDAPRPDAPRADGETESNAAQGKEQQTPADASAAVVPADKKEDKPEGSNNKDTDGAVTTDTAPGKQRKTFATAAAALAGKAKKQNKPEGSNSEELDKAIATDKSGCTLRILRHASELPDDDNILMVLRWQTEWIISFFKQFIRPVTQKEFRIMRAAFMLEHHRSRNFDFMEYLTNALDDDVSEVVKISTAGWITLITVQVLWAPVQYTGWVFLGFATVFVMLVLIVCAKLVTVVRHVTRGGRVNKLDPDVFWFDQPRLLLPVVRYTLFINSAIFAIMASLAIQYGARSCAFHGHDGDDNLRYSAWLIILLINLGSFFHISFVMLPTYSLVVHMGSTHWSHHLLNDNVKETIMNLRKRVAQDRSTGGRGRTEAIP